MDRLLSQQEIDNAFKMANSQAAQDDAPKAEPYDFRRTDRIAKDQLRTIHFLHENFARSMSSSLSAYLRSYVVVNLISVEQLSFLEFTQSLSSPTSLITLGLKPYDGSAILEINPSLAFPIVEMLLGRKRQGADAADARDHRDRAERSRRRASRDPERPARRVGAGSGHRIFAREPGNRTAASADPGPERSRRGDRHRGTHRRSIRHDEPGDSFDRDQNAAAEIRSAPHGTQVAGVGDGTGKNAQAGALRRRSSGRSHAAAESVGAGPAGAARGRYS